MVKECTVQDWEQDCKRKCSMSVFSVEIGFEVTRQPQAILLMSNVVS